VRTRGDRSVVDNDVIRAVRFESGALGFLARRRDDANTAPLRERDGGHADRRGPTADQERLPFAQLQRFERSPCRSERFGNRS